LLFPAMQPATVTAISMTTVFFNSASGSVAYARMRRVDFKTGALFALVMLPGSVVGTLLTEKIPRDMFNMIFGVCMVLFAAVIVVKSRIGDRSAPYGAPGKFRARRIFTDKDGRQTAFSFNLLAGMTVSLFVGFLSGFLGIGGGIIHVPVLVFLGFPAHFATATSHFVLAGSSLISLIIHLASGALRSDYVLAFSLAGGAVVGAQLGARFSKKVKGSVLMFLLAVALVMAGVRIFLSGMGLF
ncbi:MAG: sulfite exporter TauE/SafE family protein, partial [Firmicutes bacterium]|nr:sulfite exporter TauE/SafE family protein [Bacillota bacterium]